MADRKPSRPLSPEEQQIQAEVEKRISNDAAVIFLGFLVRDFVDAHNPVRRRAYSELDDRKRHKLSARAQATSSRAASEYADAIFHLGALVADRAPVKLASENDLRTIFGVVRAAPILADDYVGREIKVRARDEALRRAAMAHAGGFKPLAEAYQQLEPSRTFLGQYGLTRKVQVR